MPKIIGKSQTVVSHDGLTIDELAGNVATSSDTLSIAHVHVTHPTAEPWLTLDYDEWICVTHGLIELHYETEGQGMQVLTVQKGETVFVEKGERFRPMFPQGDTSYIPVCLPAFRPDRCLREEEEGASDVTKKLRELHGMEGGSEKKDEEEEPVQTDVPTKDILYHMCQKSKWEEAVSSGKAYFPPTFEEDGQFTHATAVPARLITTANHFYTQTTGEWMCLQLSRSALTNVGIVTKDEGALPVGEQSTSEEWEDKGWICPHIYGGIPTMSSLGVVTKTYKMIRDEEGIFLNIEHLTA